MTADPAQIRAAGALLAELATGLQSLALYPTGHPQRARLGATLLARAQSLLHEGARDLTFFVDHGSFYVATTLLVRESLSLGRLADAFAAAGVESFTVTPTTTAADLEGLLEVLTGERARPAVIGGLRINALRPTRPSEHAWQERLAELRRAYAAGIDVLKESAARAAAGEPIDLDAATGVVEQLSDEVSRDPGFGLLLSAVKSYDEYTYFHMVNVCLMSVALGQLIGLRRDQVHVLGLGALLHDIGKVYVPAEILRAPGRLDEEQWRLVQRHPVDGAGLLFATGGGLYHPAASIVFEHHAAYDATGYPTLHAHPPAVPGRLVAVADCYDAVTSKRPYREPLDRHEALTLLDAGAGQGLDPDAVRVFERLLGDFPIGSLVLLATGEVALVVRQHARLRDQPTVLVLLDAGGAPTEVEERDLAARPDSAIARRLNVRDVGLDITHFVVSGEIVASGAPGGPADLVYEPSPGGPAGLVHEPSPGEAVPEGYVDTHREGPHPRGRPDPDVAPPID